MSDTKMNSFKFNFSLEENEEKPKDDVEEKPKYDSTIDEDNIDKIQFKEINLEETVIKHIDTSITQYKELSYGDSKLKCISADDALCYLIHREQNVENITLAEQLHSDIVEEKYEGGFKIWECTNDLADFMQINNPDDYKNKTVLDLGCGVGLLGIVALTRGGTVHFQDYNEEVLRGACLPNVVLNTPENKRSHITSNSRFFAGDWNCFYEETEKNPNDFKYDFILTSETIYNTKNYPILYKLIKNRLKRTGYALIAAKSHYFGVGGSVTQFVDFVNGDGVMKCEIPWKSEEGLSREIIKVYFPT